MHFKSALILCTVYFFSPVWSAGLNKNHLEKCLQLYNDGNTNTDISNIGAAMDNFFKFKINYTYNTGKDRYVNFQNLFLAIAYADKPDDSFEDSILTYFEAEFFINEFIGHSEYYKDDPIEGYLTGQQLSVVFKDLYFTNTQKDHADNLISKFKGKNRKEDYTIGAKELLNILLDVRRKDEAKLMKLLCPDNINTSIGNRTELTYKELLDVFESLKLEKKDKYKVERECGYVITLVEFLLVVLEVLPEGNGLNKTQIEELNGLYTSAQKTPDLKISEGDIQEVFKKFKMATTDHDHFFKFKARRPAAKELMELMIVTAERSTTVHGKEEVVLSTKDVRRLMSDFTKLDTEGKGVLSTAQVTTFVNNFQTENREVQSYSFGNNATVGDYLLFFIHQAKNNTA